MNKESTTQGAESMETRKVYAVMSNSDLIEGRGNQYVKAYCETQATAIRIGRKGYIQGGDCPIEVKTLFKPEGETRWHGPVKIEGPTDVDRKAQIKINEQNAALAKARFAGLSEDEIKLIKSAQQ